MHQRALLFSALMAGVSAQQVGTQKTETHPALTWQECTSSGCTDKSGSVVVDANWRWVHSVDGYTNCYTGNTVCFIVSRAILLTQLTIRICHE
jgi:cellulose 1,4-beta-cellobiosidase